MVLKANNDWYKPREEYDDALTITDVYISMSEEHQYVLKRLLKHAANRTLPNSSEADYLSDIFNTFTDNEKLTTYYLANEAVLKGNEVFKILELWVLLKGEKNA